MSFVAGAIKLAVFLMLGNWLFRRMMSSRWRWHWGTERTILAGFFVFFYVIRLAVEMLDYLPRVGSFFAAAPLDSLIQRIDPDLPWSSLGGWLVAELAPWVILCVAVLLLAWLRPGKAVAPLVIVILWFIIYLGYSALISALGLPDRVKTGFASFYAAVLQRIGPSDLSASALAAGGFFTLLVLSAILLHLVSFIRQRARREFPRDNLAPYRKEGLGAFGAVLGYVLVLRSVLVGLSDFLFASLRDASALPLRGGLVFFGLFAFASLGVTLLYQRLSGPEYLFQGLALRRSRWQDWLLGLMSSFFLVGLLTLAGQFLGWWRLTGAREVSWSALLGYLGIFLVSAIAFELAFRGYVLQKLNTALGFRQSVAVAALLQLFCLPLPPRGAWIAVPGYFVAGLFAGALFWLSRSLWLPIAFHFGWNLALGPVFGHPVSGLVCGQVFILARGDIPAWQSGGAFGPEGGVISLGVLLLGLWMLRWHS